MAPPATPERVTSQVCPLLRRRGEFTEASGTSRRQSRCEIPAKPGPLSAQRPASRERPPGLKLNAGPRHAHGSWSFHVAPGYQRVGDVGWPGVVHVLSTRVSGPVAATLAGLGHVPRAGADFASAPTPAPAMINDHRAEEDGRLCGAVHAPRGRPLRLPGPGTRDACRRGA